MKMALVKLGDSYKPAYLSDHKNSAKHKQGEIVWCSITKAINVKFHKKYFAVLRMANDAGFLEKMGIWVNPDWTESNQVNLIRIIMKQLFLQKKEVYVPALGITVGVWPSQTFDDDDPAKMTQEERKVFYERTVETIIEYTHITREDIDRESNKYA